MSFQILEEGVEFQKQKKGELATEFTPLSLVPERLSQPMLTLAALPHRWTLVGSAALQSVIHERSFCLSVSGWIAPSAAGDVLGTVGRSLPFAGEL